MKRCVIVGGAPIDKYQTIKKYITEDDFIICCDCGLRHADSLGIKPNLITGDFDSYIKPESSVETIVLPCEKDDTDTFFAVKEAYNRGYRDFLLIGFFGARLDHTLGNISILLWLHNHEANAIAIDDYSEMEIVSDKPIKIPDSFSFFSLVTLTGDAKGVNISNAKYPLVNADLNCEYQYAVSNEVISGDEALVSVQKGKLLLIKDF